MIRRLLALAGLAAVAGCSESDSIVQPNFAVGAGPAQVPALILAGTESAFGANALGELAGRVGVPGAFHFSAGTGVVTLGTPGRAYDLSEDGLTVAGFTGVCCAGAFVQVKVGGNWQYTVLPKDPAASYHSARGVASDPTTGAAVYVGGVEAYPAGGNSTNRQPRLWAPASGGWTRLALPAPAGSDNPLFDVNATGAATGEVGGRASAWLPDGAGGWTVGTFGAAGSRGWAINATSTIVVGYTGSAAQYWTLSGGVWTGHGLPGGCSEAVDIDTLGRILANGCTNGKGKSPAVIAAPYGSANVQLLAGVGTSGTIATAHRMAANGSWIAGDAPSKNTTVGVYWTLP